MDNPINMDQDSFKSFLRAVVFVVAIFYSFQFANHLIYASREDKARQDARQFDLYDWEVLNQCITDHAADQNAPVECLNSLFNR